MLYLLTPPAALECCDSASGDAPDLGALGWTDAGRLASEDMIRLALRYGTRCSRGIVLDGVILQDLERATVFREANDQSNIDRAKVNDIENARMEAAHPGWTRRGEKMDDQVEVVVTQMMDEFDARAARELVAPVDPDLLAAWTDLGGQVPTDG